MATIAKLDVLLSLDDQLSDKLGKTQDKLRGIGDTFRRTGAMLTAGVTAPIIGSGIAMVNWAADFEESVNKTEVLFGSATQTVMDFSDNSARSMGMSRQTALDMTAAYAGMLQPIAADNDELARMSTEMTGLTADFASFHNLNPEEAWTVIQSAMAGETEAIRRYGVDVSAAAVEHKALEMGLAGSTAELTEQDKALARYNLILEQTTEEQGDFARTSDSVSNKMKIMRARTKDIATAFGRLLLPVADSLLDAFDGLLNVLDGMSPSARRLALIIAGLAAAVGPLLIAVGFLFPLLATGLGIFAALLSPIGLLVAAVGLLAFAFRDELGAAISWISDQVSTFIDLWQDLRDMGLNPVQAALAALQQMFPALGEALANLRTMFDALGDAFDALRAGDIPGVFAAIGRAVRALGSAILNTITAIDWGALVSRLGDLAGNLAGWVWDQVTSVDWPGTISSAIAAVWDFVVDLPDIVVNIARWAAGKLADIWSAITGWVLGGSQGDGTGGPLAGAVGGITLGEVIANITEWAKGALPDIVAKIEEWIGDVTVALAEATVDVAAWAEGTLPDVAAKIEEWIGTVAVTLAEVAASIAAWTVSDFNKGNLVSKIELGIGTVIVETITATVGLVKWSIANANTQLLQALLYVAVITGVTLSLIPMAVPFMLTLGLIFGLFLVAVLLARSITAWAIANPVEAVDILVSFMATYENVIDGLPSKSDIAEWIINQILGATGSSIEINLPISFSIGGGDDDKSVFDSDDQLPATSPTTPGAAGGGGGKGDRFFGGSGGLGKINIDIARQLDTIKATVTTKVGEIETAAGKLGTAFDASGTAISAFGASTTATITAWGSAVRMVVQSTYTALQSQTQSTMSQMRSIVTSTMTALRSTVQSAFTTMRSQTQSALMAMRSTLQSAFTAMRSTVTSTMSAMQSQIASSMNAARSAATSAANAMRASVVAAMQSMTSQAVSTVRAGMMQIPGIIASVGGAAAATARSIGAMISQGFAAGMLSALAVIRSAATQMVQAANDALVAKAMISSPSRLFMDHGEMLGEGLALGIDHTNRRVASATENLVNVPGTVLPRGGTVVNNYFALTSDEFKKLQADAEDGGQFARRFGGELAMLGGRV